MTGTDAVGQDHNPILIDTTAKVTMTLTEAIPGQMTGTTEGITGGVHDAHTQGLIHIILIMTLHIKGHLYTGAHQLTQETTADHALIQPTNQLQQPCTKSSSQSRRPKGKMHTKRNSRVAIDNQQLDFTVQMIIPVIQKKTQTI